MFRLAAVVGLLAGLTSVLTSSSALAIYQGNVIQNAPPWAAFVTTSSYLLGHVKNPLAQETSCTGTVVAQGWVLTAAHCVFEENASGQPINTKIPLGNLRVVLGRSDLSKGFILGGQWTVTAVSVFSGWNPKLIRGDLALLHLKGDLPKKALPLALAPSGFGVGDGTNAVAYGYGHTAENYNTKGQVTRSNDTTRLRVTKDGSYSLQQSCTNATRWCFKRNGPSETLHGDSGGPWALTSTANFIIGVQSVDIGLHREANGTGFYAGAGATNVADPAIHDFIVKTTGIVTGQSGTIYRDAITGAAGLMEDDGFLHSIADGGTYTCLQGRGHSVTNLQPFEMSELPLTDDGVSCSTPITFDDQPTGTSITTQYISRGIVFSSPEGPSIADDSSNPTTPVLSPGPSFSGHLTMSFVSPGSGAATTVAAVDFDVGFINDAGVEITWFDPTGAQIGSETINNLGIQHVELQGNRMAKVVIDTTADSFGAAVDNLSFGQ